MDAIGAPMPGDGAPGPGSGGDWQRRRIAHLDRPDELVDPFEEILGSDHVSVHVEHRFSRDVHLRRTQ